MRVSDDLCGRPGILCGWQTTCARGRQLVRAADDLCGSLARKMSRALVAFARTGNPNHSGIPRWPAYSAANPANMIFDEKVEVRSDPDREARRLIAERGKA